MIRSRQERRRASLPEAHITSLEDDMDDTEESIDRLRDELRGIKSILFGILVTLTTSSLLLAANFVFGMHH